MIFPVASPGPCVSRAGLRQEYAERIISLGVLEYVVIDRMRRRVTVYVDAAGRYRKTVLHPGDRYGSRLLPGLEVPVVDIALTRPGCEQLSDRARFKTRTPEALFGRHRRKIPPTRSDPSGGAAGPAVKFIVEGFLTGLHASPFQGFSVEFSEHRKYNPGDDPSNISTGASTPRPANTSSRNSRPKRT